MKTRSTVLLSSLVAAAMAAGCGGCGGKTPTAPTTPPSGGGDGGGGAPPAKAGGPYTVAPVANGVTISGTASWAGASVPVAASTKSTLAGAMRDAETCDNPMNVVQDLLVDAGSKGVANVVVYLKGITSGKALPGGATLDNKGCVFMPHVVIQPSGEAGLKISNSDPVGHNTHLFPRKNDDFNKKIDQGQAPVMWGGPGAKLRAEGPVKISCDLHSWMSAWVFVVDHPYYAVSGRDGRFSLAEVPAGAYTLVAWHEWTGKDKQWPDGSKIEKSITFGVGGTVTADVTLSDSGLAWR